jgi:hypothetical protein
MPSNSFFQSQSRVEDFDRRNSENKTVFKVANQTGYFAPDCKGLEKLMGKILQKCLTGFPESWKIGWFSGFP